VAGAIVMLGLAVTVYDANATWKAQGSRWDSDPGIRGDFWGGHLAAASGLAGAVLMFGALGLQRYELSLQREDLKVQQTEFKKAREEAERQANAMEGQLAHAKRQAEAEEYAATLRLLMDIGERAVAAREIRQKDPRPLLKAGFGRILEQAHQDVAVAEQAEYPMALVSEMLDLFLAAVVGLAKDQISAAWKQAVQVQSPVSVARGQLGEAAEKRMAEWIESAGERIKA
jgi:hypothetical protein